MKQSKLQCALRVLRDGIFAMMTVAVVTQSVVAQTPPPKGNSRVQEDTLDARYVPVGFGKLRQDDITIRITLTGGLQVRVIPLDESIIRLLSPDSYRVMQQFKENKRRAIDSIADRMRLQKYSLWYVMFSGVEQGEARFSPQELIIQNVGRDFRPIEVLPMTTGFGEYRLKQRETQSALYVFDGQIDTNQPLSVLMENTPSSTDWNSVLQRIEQERAAARTRASAATKPPEVKPPMNFH